MLPEMVDVSAGVGEELLIISCSSIVFSPRQDRNVKYYYFLTISSFVLRSYDIRTARRCVEFEISKFNKVRNLYTFFRTELQPR